MRELFATYGMPLDTHRRRASSTATSTPACARSSRPTRCRRRRRPTFVLKLAFKLHPELRRRTKRGRGDPGRQAVARRDPGVGAHRAGHVRSGEPRPPRRRSRRPRHRRPGRPLRGRARRPAARLPPPLRAPRLRPRPDRAAAGGGPPVGPRARGDRAGAPGRVAEHVRAGPHPEPPADRGGRERHDADHARRRAGHLAEAAAELDQYLRYRGSLVFSRYDIDGVTMGELPDVVLATILEGRDASRHLRPEAARRRAAGPRARGRPGRVRRPAHRGPVRHEPPRRQRPDDRRVAHRPDAGDDARGRPPARRPGRHRATGGRLRARARRGGAAARGAATLTGRGHGRRARRATTRTSPRSTPPPPSARPRRSRHWLGRSRRRRPR